MSDFIGEVSGALWTLALRLAETTSQDDVIWIDQSVLSGEYTPVTTGGENGGTSSVPEPTTMILLGTGIVGLAGFRKKFGL